VKGEPHAHNDDGRWLLVLRLFNFFLFGNFLQKKDDSAFYRGKNDLRRPRVAWPSQQQAAASLGLKTGKDEAHKQIGEGIILACYCLYIFIFFTNGKAMAALVPSEHVLSPDP